MKKNLIKLSIVIVVVVLLILIIGGKKRKLQGNWISKEGDEVVAFFNFDKNDFTAIYKNTFNFGEYKIKKKTIILNGVDGSCYQYNYKIKGKKLYITGNQGTMVYSKEKTKNSKNDLTKYDTWKRSDSQASLSFDRNGTVNCVNSAGLKTEMKYKVRGSGNQYVVLYDKSGYGGMYMFEVKNDELNLYMNNDYGELELLKYKGKN